MYGSLVGDRLLRFSDNSCGWGSFVRIRDSKHALPFDDASCRTDVRREPTRPSAADTICTVDELEYVLPGALDTALELCCESVFPAVRTWSSVCRQAEQWRSTPDVTAYATLAGFTCATKLLLSESYPDDEAAVLACLACAVTFVARRACSVLPQAVSYEADETATWCPRGPEAKQWVNGCMGVGVIAACICPSVRRHGGRARDAVGVVCIVEGKGPCIFCCCPACSLEGRAVRRTFSVSAFPSHGCRARSASCVCHRVYGHLAVLQAVAEEAADAVVTIETSGSSGSGAVASSPSVECMDVEWSLRWRPLWRWARLEQVWCAVRQKSVAYDWDAVWNAAPPALRSAVDGLAPPEGWEGNGYPGSS